MNKVLEALDRLKMYADCCEGDYLSNPNEDYEIVEKELIDGEKNKNVLGIIKNIGGFIDKEDFFYDDKENKYYFFSHEITEEEFDLLKEILL